MPDADDDYCPRCREELEPYGDDDPRHVWCAHCQAGFYKPAEPQS